MRKFIIILLATVVLGAGAAMAAALDLNTASQQQLESLQGVGPTRAQAIIAYREKNGPFKSVQDLNKVPGFGDKTVASLESSLSVSGQPAANAQANATMNSKANTPAANANANAQANANTNSRINTPAATAQTRATASARTPANPQQPAATPASQPRSNSKMPANSQAAPSSQSAE